ncbi:hypothetical protein CDL12_03824 [Handroanthus impetiginosus]|uniref:Cytochrome b561 domain-containing protein n=1 Tax=Handroanthus impetiginosus TaxID=429701 RepID=A0A2G9I107_9LAMI|nr:hypothetical protein CDL12_03824 [Handroanthus impetiginosus]
MSPLSIFSCLFVFFLVHSAECSLYEHDKARNNTTNEVNSQKTFDIVVHGIISWTSMGFLMPLGILTMRMSISTRDSHQRRHKILFYLHATLQVLSVLLVTVGAALSVTKFENAFNNSHQRIGLGLYAAIYLQILIGFRRPMRGTKARNIWYFIHWIIGTTISLLGTLNIYTGLQAYHKRTSRNSTLWTLIFTAQISFMTILYLFQGKWEYIQKQGIIVSGGEAEISSSGDHADDVLDEPSWKSNALGTYFSRSNALDKLFQLT